MKSGRGKRHRKPAARTAEKDQLSSSLMRFTAKRNRNPTAKPPDKPNDSSLIRDDVKRTRQSRAKAK